MPIKFKCFWNLKRQKNGKYTADLVTTHCPNKESFDFQSIQIRHSVYF